MIRALYSAASGMSAQQTNVDTIANNLANANTAGFKMRRAQFQDLLYQNVVQPGAAAGAQSIVPSGLQLGLGTRTASNEIVFTQGDFSQTTNPLDVVIQGKVENSNVAPAESAVRLVDLMRQYEMLQKAVSVSADMNKQAIDQVARVGG